MAHFDLHKHLTHHISFMDWVNFFQEEANKLIAGLIAAILAALIAFFKRVPKFIGITRTPLTGVKIVNKGSEINNIINDLSDYSGAIYVHIVRYHNGKKDKNKPIHWDKMTVEWEEIGHACDKCITACRNRLEVKRVQKEWQKIPITDNWRHKAMNKTRSLQGEINTICKGDLNEIHQSIFDRLDIECYKEVYVKSDQTEMYTLGLSFCGRFSNYVQAEGMIYLAAKQLRNII